MAILTTARPRAIAALSSIFFIALLLGFQLFADEANPAETNKQSNLVYFPHNESGQLTPILESEVPLRTLPPGSNPDGCTTGTVTCSTAYLEEDIEPIDPSASPLIYRPKSGASAQETYNKMP